MRKMMSLCYYNFLGARNLKLCFLFVFGHHDEPRNLMGHSTRFRHNGPEVWSWCGAFDLPEISWPELIFNALFYWKLSLKPFSIEMSTATPTTKFSFNGFTLHWSVLFSMGFSAPFVQFLWTTFDFLFQFLKGYNFAIPMQCFNNWSSIYALILHL